MYVCMYVCMYQYFLSAVNEWCMFCSGSPAYEKFLRSLGMLIPLLGCTMYTGGLDRFTYLSIPFSYFIFIYFCARQGVEASACAHIQFLKWCIVLCLARRMDLTVNMASFIVISSERCVGF